jgi:hypothetical protein
MRHAIRERIGRDAKKQYVIFQVNRFHESRA